MKTSFGKVGARQTFLYTIENESVSIAVTDYGASLVRFVHRRSGKDVVLGFESAEGYLGQTSYIGASVGRTANRIADGKFSLNGKEYHLPVNNSGNCNHGGLHGFDKVIWDTEEKENEIIFRYRSADGEEGYPGNLDVAVSYRLLDNGVEIKASGTPDQDTLFAYTNHSYFNLDESDNAMDHEVMIHADCFAASDRNGLAENRFIPVAGTPFDFRAFHTPGERIGDEDEQLKFGCGYDHYYPIEGSGMREFAVCRGKNLVLTVFSDQPGMHFYSANYLEGKRGKNDHVYSPRSALCFECAYMPNAVNYPEVGRQPIVRAGETAAQTIRYFLTEK